MAGKKQTKSSGPQSAISNPKSAIINALVYVLGDNIDTDQIIPARHLNLVPTIPAEYKKLGALALSGLPADYPAFIKSGAAQSEYGIIVAGRNFGCGSSREHAPIALGAAGIRAIVAESYARIFFRNAIATGEQYPCETAVNLRTVFQTGDEAQIRLDREELVHVKSGKVFKLKSLGAVTPVVSAGGLFAYARKTGMITN
jgi:3-isopropylmalate/(R)-2-methylmalate dehydratase small subunit